MQLNALRRFTAISMPTLFVLAACATKPGSRVTPVPVDDERSISDRIAAEDAPQLSVIFTAGRHLELETCGCAIANLGGMDRELNLVQEWKKSSNLPFLTISGGNVVSADGAQTAKREPYRSKKADFVVEGMKLLGVDIVSPSVSDVSWGVDRVRAWEKLSGADWVSTNIVDEKSGAPIFKPYVERHIAGFARPVFVVGLSHGLDGGKLPGIATKDPVESLGAVLKSLPSTSRFILLVSSLNAAEEEKIRARFPEVSVILDGNDRAGNSIEQLGEHTATIRMIGRGRGIARLDVAVKGPQPFVFNGDIAHENAIARDQWAASIASIEQSLKNHPKKKQLANLLAEKKRLQNEIDRHQFFGFTHFQDGLNYSATTASVDSSHEQPRNAISELFDRYHEAVRGLAVDEE